jgi:nucleoid-associated protein YgaU
MLKSEQSTYLKKRDNFPYKNFVVQLSKNPAAPVQPKEYIVKYNQTLFDISLEVYGNHGNWFNIGLLNNIHNPYDLSTVSKVILP